MEITPRKTNPVTLQELLQLRGDMVAALHGYSLPEKGQNISLGMLKMCCSPSELSGAGSPPGKSYSPRKQDNLLPTKLFQLALIPLSGVLKRRTYGLGAKLELYSIPVPCWAMQSNRNLGFYSIQQKDLVFISEK